MRVSEHLAFGSENLPFSSERVVGSWGLAQFSSLVGKYFARLLWFKHSR